MKLTSMIGIWFNWISIYLDSTPPGSVFTLFYTRPSRPRYFCSTCAAGRAIRYSFKQPLSVSCKTVRAILIWPEQQVGPYVYPLCDIVALLVKPVRLFLIIIDWSPDYTFILHLSFTLYEPNRSCYFFLTCAAGRDYDSTSQLVILCMQVDWFFVDKFKIKQVLTLHPKRTSGGSRIIIASAGWRMWTTKMKNGPAGAEYNEMCF